MNVSLKNDIPKKTNKIAEAVGRNNNLRIKRKEDNGIWNTLKKKIIKIVIAIKNLKVMATTTGKLS